VTTTPLSRYLADIRAHLTAREEAQLLRTCELPSGIDLTSNDYLGFASDPELSDKVAQAIKTYGAGSGASRLLRGSHAFFQRIEAKLALFSGSESALLFSSGFAANIGLLPAILEPTDAVFSDALNHASLIDGIRLSRATCHVFPHQDFAALEALLVQEKATRKVIVTESLFSMDGDLTDLTALVKLAETHDAVVVVDEAHATGLFGERGSGRVEALGLTKRVLCSMHTGGKALGIGGAWVAGDKELIQFLVNFARSFVFSTAPVPALALGLEASLDHLANHPGRRTQLETNAKWLREWLRAHDIPIGQTQTQIIPIIAGDAKRTLDLAARLKNEGFDVRAVRPPTVPDGTSRLRVAVRSLLTSSELKMFAEALVSGWTEVHGEDSK
jgi:8-amino-7-oxononanoate synthase